MKLQDTYLLIATRLTPLYGVGEARAMARMLLEERYGVSRTEWIMHPEMGLTAAQHDDLEHDLQRLEQWTPVQYVIGRAEFMGRDFEVTPAVLIPRDETAELVGHIIARHAATPSLTIADIGTGSGAIAISLALALPEARVTAYDLSPEALAVAQANAHSHGAQVDFELADALDTDLMRWKMSHNPPDIIVSNPPYVTPLEREQMRENVTLHEPSLALYVPEDDPLLFYRAIAALPAYEVWFEINERFGNEVANLLRERGFAEVTIIKDIHERDRMVCGIKDKQ